MKRRVVALSISLLALASLVFAGGAGLPSLSVSQPQEQSQRPSISGNTPERDYVEMKSDEGWQMEHNGKKIMVVVGNFAAHHNGTVITADSAVRYNERHIECFGNVLINRGSTYIYGDRAEYDGETNEARVYSKIVKVVDGNATLYTYNFKFNTQTNIGRYSGGGVLVSGENMLESDRGYLYSDNHEVICVERVQMRNKEYDMMGDSVVYNTETDFAQFFTRTNIWNKSESGNSQEDDYLYADRGTFDKAKQLYTLTLNGYILTKDQELLCDTLDYYRDSNYVRLKRNIQIDDTSQKMIIFGDWGEYWKEPGNVFVTKNPSAISYDLSQGDSLFMRSDSMYVYTRYPIREKIEQARKDSLAQAAKQLAADSLQGKKNVATADVAVKRDVQEGSRDVTGDRRADRRVDRRAERRAEKRGEAPNANAAATSQNLTPTPTPSSATQNSAAEIADSTKVAVDTAKVAVDTIKVATDTTKVVVKTKAELRRVMIDSLINDTINPRHNLLAKLLKEEAVEINKIVKAKIKEEQRRRKAERDSILAERHALYVVLLGEARIRDAERRKIECAEAKRIKDSLKVVNDSIERAEKVVADSLKRVEKIVNDSLKRAEKLAKQAAKRAVKDTLQLDSLRRDSLQLNLAKVDSVKIDSLAKSIVAADSIKLVMQTESLKPDSLKRDALPLDSLKLDAVKLDTVKLDTVKFNAAVVDTMKLDLPKSDSLKVDSLAKDSLKVDSLKLDSLQADTLAKFDTMTVKQVKAYFKAIYDAEKAEEDRIKQDSLDAKLDRIGLARQAQRAEQYRKWAIRDSIFNAKAQERADEQLRRKLARMERRGIYLQMADSAELRIVDSILLAEFGPLDSIVVRSLDSLIEILYPKPLPSPTAIAKSDSLNIDSLYREIRAYSRVKMYRSDFQSVCDSLTMTTIDSIINMYKLPVLWNGSSQITSDIMHIRTRNSQLVQADFEGTPLTVSEIDTVHYNQVTGKEMTALFRDNEIYRNDVKGNVQTIYYMQEDDSPDITLMAYIEAGDMTSYIENQQVVGITYRGSPTYTFFPMDKIPEDQPTKLPNFKWEASRRPTQDSVFTRTIRPSQRIEKRSLRRPLFPINALMQQRRDDYIRRREWQDRTDTLTYETIEWLESLKSF